MWMSPKLWSLISMLIILQIMLASCTRDLKFDGFDPTTSIVKWVFTGDSHIAHQRNDNSRYKWYYDSSTGEFGDRVAY